MAKQNLENGATFGTQRAKINENFTEVYEGLTSKVDKDGSKVLSDVNFTTTKDAKLSGVATGATANQTNAYLVDRANHTGLQAISTVAGLQTSLDGKLSSDEEIPADILPSFSAQDISAIFNEEHLIPLQGKMNINIQWLTSFIQSVVGGGGNIKPAPPTLSFDDTANTLSASHVLGASEILMSVNNGAYSAYTGTINVGDVVRSAGYWKFKTKAATGRDESDFVNSPAFTASGGGVNLGTYATQLQYAQNASNDTEGNFTRTDPGQGSPIALAISFATNENGFINHAYRPLGSISGEGSTGEVTIGNNLDPYFGANDGIAAIWAQTGGQVVYKIGSSNAIYSAQGVLSDGGIMQLRFDATTVYVEYSNDEGVNWVTLTTTPRTAGVIRSKENMAGNQYRIFNLRQFKG